MISAADLLRHIISAASGSFSGKLYTVYAVFPVGVLTLIMEIIPLLGGGDSCNQDSKPY